MSDSSQTETQPKGTVFFDYDGTLHDTMRIYGPALREACAWLREEGWNAPEQLEDKQISCWLGHTVADMWAGFMPELPEEVWREASHKVGQAMQRHADEGDAQLFDGVTDMLEELKESGFEICFLSNCRRGYVKQQRELFGLDRWISAYYCAEDFDFISKAGIYQAVREKHGWSAEAGLSRPHLMVGDRLSDMEVASQSEIPAVGCAYGYAESFEELEAATFVVDDPSSVPPAIEVLARWFGR